MAVLMLPICQSNSLKEMKYAHLFPAGGVQRLLSQRYSYVSTSEEHAEPARYIGERIVCVGPPCLVSPLSV